MEDFGEEVFLLEIVNFCWFVGRGGEPSLAVALRTAPHPSSLGFPLCAGQCDSADECGLQSQAAWAQMLPLLAVCLWANHLR